MLVFDPMSIAGAFLGVLVAGILVGLVLPKLESSCALPMPPLRSYILGHAVDILDVRRLLRVQMDWFREYGEVFQLWLVHRRVVVTAHPDDVAAVLGRPELFARPHAQTALFNDLQPDSFQTMPRDIHKKQRARMRDAFSPATVAAFSDTVQNAIDDLLRHLYAKIEEDPNMPINFTPHLADTTFRILLEAVLGSKMKSRDRAAFACESRAFLTEMLIEICTYPLRRCFALLGVRRKLFRQHQIVQAYAHELVKKRWAETEDEAKKRPFDILDVILELDPTDLHRQTSNVTMFAIAGFESSSEALAWALYEITGHSSVAEKIRTEVDFVLGEKTTPSYNDVSNMPYLSMVWRETVRLHPAAGFLLRVAAKNTVLPGTDVSVPAGVQVGALIAGAQRHPRYVNQPNSFLPERWAQSGENAPRGLLAFSCGPERCPGRPLADFECIAILAALYRSFHIELACESHEVQGISDWTERARTRAPGAPLGDTSWSLPVKLFPRYTGL